MAITYKMSEKRRKAAEAASYARMGGMLLRGKKMTVNWIDGQDLGYTSGRKPINVFINWEHDLAKGLPDKQKSFFRLGVFAHETLHQVFTHFKYTNEVLESLPAREQPVFMSIANLVEDPAIEYQAPLVMGGKMLRSLRYTIRRIYRKSPPIGKEPTAFIQLENALVHYGDMGKVKGDFTFPEAFEYFKKIAPKVNEGIECPDAKKRIDIYKEIFEMTRPLWEKDLDASEEFSKFLEEVSELIKKLVKEKGKIPLVIPSEGVSEEDKSEEDKRRGELAKALSGSSQDGEEADSKEHESEASEVSSSESKDGSESPEKDSKSSPLSPDKKDEKLSDEELKDLMTDEEEYAEDDSDEWASFEEEMDDLEKMIEEENKRVCEDVKEEGESPLPEFDLSEGSSSKFMKASCKNIRMKSDYSTARVYNEFLREYAWDITALTKSLKKILAQKQEESLRSTSGRYNILRGERGTSAKIFDKKRQPNIYDTEVCLLIDESGSMDFGRRIVSARKAAIIFAEALAALKVPCYILGFSADEMVDRTRVNAVHRHYVTWNGSKKERESLAKITSHANNFDSYSIRYAGSLLKQRSAGQRILFVISDGEPACNMYRSTASGVIDTTLAIKEVRKEGITVFGIAIGGGCAPEVLQSYYGKDFIHQPDDSLLAVTLSKKLVKVFDKGD